MMRKYHVRFGGGPTEKGSQDHLAGGLPNYAGSGPAQTSLAILADAAGAEKAVALYQRFKASFIAPAERRGFRIPKEAIERWVAAHYRIPEDALDEWAKRFE